MNRIWCLLLLFTLFCQRNTPDADELLPVTSAAVWERRGEYHLLLEGARQSSLDGNAEPVYLRASSDTLAGLLDNAQAAYADHLTFTHTSLVVLDDSLTPTDLRDLCAVLTNVQGAPRSAYLSISEDAEEMLTHEHPTEEIPGLALRDLLRAQELTGSKSSTLADGRDQPTDSLTLPLLALTEDEQVVCGGVISLAGTGGAL